LHGPAAPHFVVKCVTQEFTGLDKALGEWTQTASASTRTQSRRMRFPAGVSMSTEKRRAVKSKRCPFEYPPRLILILYILLYINISIN